MQQHRLSLVKRKYVVGLKIAIKANKAKIALFVNKNNITFADSLEATVKIDVDDRFGDDVC